MAWHFDRVGTFGPHRRPKVKLLELRLVLGLGVIKPDTLVFSTVEGGLLSPDNLSRDWRRISTSRKLPRVSFHALRHTHASVLIGNGVDILTISRRLGHYKPSVTRDVYGHDALDWHFRWDFC